jgi:23S rRNA G2069 N7-methylase RlmK/C1962 C5-methylase RlmI
MLQDLLGNNYVLKENANQEQSTRTTTGMQWGKALVVNLEDYSKSSQGHPKIVILDSPSTTTPLALANKLKIPLEPRTTCVKHKRSNVFSLVLEALDKNSIVFVDAMERINVMQLKIEKHHNKIQKRTTK